MFAFTLHPSPGLSVYCSSCVPPFIRCHVLLSFVICHQHVITTVLYLYSSRAERLILAEAVRTTHTAAAAPGPTSSSVLDAPPTKPRPDRWLGWVGLCVIGGIHHLQSRAACWQPGSSHCTTSVSHIYYTCITKSTTPQEYQQLLTAKQKQKERNQTAAFDGVGVIQ